MSTLTLAEMYDDHGIDEHEFYELLSQSLSPRAPEMLFDLAGAAGLSDREFALDIGARDATYACALAERFGCRVLAIDPLPFHTEKARAVIRTRGMEALVTIRQGTIESLPADENGVDFIWCRDMLNHVESMEVALLDCARVLKPGGKMLIYQTFATDRLSDTEAAELYAPLVVTPHNMAPATLEQAADNAGFVTELDSSIGSEWREYGIESDRPYSTAIQLLYAARLRRQPAKYIAAWGDISYRVELANCLWGVYQMIGKLEPRVYVLRAT